jgi:hypothetical protein
MGFPRHCPAASGIVALSLSFFVLFGSAAASGSKCFNPAGQETSAQVCNVTAEISMCCDEGFACLSNGLCTQGPDFRGQSPFNYYRSGCTDEEWDSESCPQFCLGGEYLHHFQTRLSWTKRSRKIQYIQSSWHCALPWSRRLILLRKRYRGLLRDNI